MPAHPIFLQEEEGWRPYCPCQIPSSSSSSSSSRRRRRKKRKDDLFDVDVDRRRKTEW